MTSVHREKRVTATGGSYRTLVAVSEAIVSHRDWAVLFHERAGQLHPVVRFAYHGQRYQPTVKLHRRTNP